MRLDIVITQEFIIDIDTAHYAKIFNSNMTTEEIIEHIKEQISRNHIYWNILRPGKTTIEARPK